MTRRRTPSVLTALNTALRARPAANADAATVALAKRYALELDDSAVISKSLAKTLRKLDLDRADDYPGAGELYDEIYTLATRIEEVHVAALVGPKLLAALAELQMTPKARAGVIQGGGGANAGKSALDELRDRRANRTATLDPAP